MAKDLKSDIKIVQSVAHATRTTNTQGYPVDRVGFESVTALIHVGDWTDGTFTFGADHSFDNSEWEAVPATDLIGSAVVSGEGSPSTSDEAGTTIAVGYIGTRRYFRPKVTASGAPATGAFIGVDILLGHAHNRPVA